MSNNRVLQVKLLDNKTNFIRAIVELILKNNDIEYEFVNDFTRPGLSVGSEYHQPLCDAIIGCVHIMINKSVLSTFTSMEVILEVAGDTQSKPISKRFRDIERIMSEIVAQDILPVYQKYIDAVKKLIAFQYAGLINHKLLNLYREVTQKEVDSDSVANFLTAIIKDLLEPAEGNIQKSDIYKWNDGFNVIHFDFSIKVIKLYSIINVLRTI
jgi:hypothetical protein